MNTLLREGGYCQRNQSTRKSASHRTQCMIKPRRSQFRLKRPHKVARIVKWPRTQKPRKYRKRSRQVIPDGRKELLSQVSSMDIVLSSGASSPRGETQDIDYDTG